MFRSWLSCLLAKPLPVNSAGCQRTLDKMKDVLQKNHFSPPFFIFPHLTLCSEVVGDARCVYWCALYMLLASQGFLD